MPFNIELPTGKNAIKIQVVKNVITIYFYGEDAEQQRKKWSHLNGHFLGNISEFSPNDVLIPSSLYHRKKAHTNAFEQSTIHLHTHFSKEVTPVIFLRYLVGFYRNQASHSKNYAFFQSASAVSDIADAFKCYYDRYKKSSLETTYENETILSFKEQQEYKAEVEKVQLQEQPQYAILITSFAHPVFINLPATISSVTNSKMEDEEVDADPWSISIKSNH